jgi:hypothetical protein
MKSLFPIGVASLLSLLFGSPNSSVFFRDVSNEIGVDFQHDRCATRHKYLVETMGSGVALFDFDNDGYLDLYFANGASLVSPEHISQNRLYRNLGNGRFADVTASSGTAGTGYGMGVACGDYNNDGWVDLYVVNFGKNILYRNNGNGTFTDVTDRSGVGNAQWGSSAAFFDLENDGDLDLYVVNYLEYGLENPRRCGDENNRAYCHPSHFPGARDVLYRNNGDGTFSDITQSAGVDGLKGKGLGIGLWDFDDDGFLDLYIANDTDMNFLYHNKGDGTFRDISLQSGAAFDENGVAEAGMGVTIGDYDQDGRADIFVTNFSGETNTLYRQEKPLFFRDVTHDAGLALPSLPYVGFGTCFFDYDADSDLDLFVANGHILDNIEAFSDSITYPEPNLLFENRGGRFLDVSPGSSINREGLFVSRGTALGDLDNDGDLDLVVSNSGGRPQILLNETPQGNRLMIQVAGKESNRSAIGTRVRWVVNGRAGQAMVDTSGSYLSAKDPRIFIGAGPATALSRLEVTWSTGKLQVFQSLQTGFLYRLSEGDEIQKIAKFRSSQP